MATNHDFSRDPAYQAFRRVAQNVKSFAMPSICWIAFCPDAVHMPVLTELSLNYARGEDGLAGRGSELELALTHLLSLVGGCRQTLRRLSIGVNHYGDGHDLQEATSRVPEITCPELEQLELHTEAFALQLPLFKSQPCMDVRLSLRSNADWARLRLLLGSEEPACLPNCRRLFIDFPLFDPRGDLEDLLQYSDTQAILQARKIDVSVSLHAASYPFPHFAQVIECLEDMRDDLVEVHCRLSDAEFEPDEAYGDSEGTVLSKCKKIEWTIDGEIGDEQEEMQGHAFEAMMRLIEAPMLETFILNMTTPYSDYIPALLWALRRDSFPKLRRIEGCLSTGYYKEGWEDQIRGHRKTMFELECADLGICLDDLEWK